MSLTKITNRLVGSSLKTAISGSDIAESSSFSTRTTALESDSGSFSTRTTALESDSGSFSTRTTTVEGRVNQGVKTTDSPTFAGATINGTLTASEIHTTFVSSSVATITGSNVFGDAVGDLHSFTGSVSISGSQTSLVTAGNVDFNGDLDVDGTTNLDVVDIDGAVDMASTLAVANTLTVTTDNENMARFDGLQGNIDFRYGSDIEFDRAGQVYITANNGSGELNFRTGGQNTRMHIDSSGKVGIGTNNPGSNLVVSSSTKTDVLVGGNSSVFSDNGRSNVEINGSGTSTLGMTIDGAAKGLLYHDGTDSYFRNYAAGYYAMYTNNTERMRIASDGRVAVKATSFPQDFGGERGHLLISSVDNAGANNYAVLQLQGHSVANDVAVGSIAFYDHSNNTALIQTQRDDSTSKGNILFYTNGGSGVTERMRIGSDGRVGIGSSSPAGLIDVMGSSGYAYFTTTSPAAFNMIFRSGSADPQNNWLGQIEFTGNTSSASQIVTRNASSLALGSNNVQTLFITDDDNVGIGTATPGSPLTVFRDGTGQVAQFGCVTVADNASIYLRCNGIFEFTMPGAGQMRFSPGGSEALTLNASQNATFAGSVTSNTGFVTNEGNLRRLASLTINDNNINNVAQVNQKSFLVYVNDSAGGFSSIVLHTGGSGIAYNWHMFDTDSNTWFENASTITSTGTNGNTYNFSFNTGNGYIRIQRTNGSLSFDIRLYQIFE